MTEDKKMENRSANQPQKQEKAQNKTLNVQEIQRLIPHRYPFLLLDRVVDLGQDYAVALKNVSINEELFNGHFPAHPVMPGVLIIEALAQASAVLVSSLQEEEENDARIVYFTGIKDAAFRKPVVPGDSLYLHVNILRSRGNYWKMRGEARVEGELVAEAEFSAMMMEG